MTRLTRCCSCICSVNGRELLRSKTLPSIPIHEYLGQQDVLLEYASGGGGLGVSRSARTSPVSGRDTPPYRFPPSGGGAKGRSPTSCFYIPGKCGAALFDVMSSDADLTPSNVA